MKLKQYEQTIMVYAVEVTKYLISRGSSLQDAEDTVQDTLVKLLDLDLFIPPDKLRGWIFRVSIRSYINKYRRHQKYSQIIQDLTRESPTFTDLTDEKGRLDLTKFLTELSKSDGQLLQAYYYENLSVKALAEKLGKSPGAIKIQLYRARQKLKKILEQAGFDGTDL